MHPWPARASSTIMAGVQFSGHRRMLPWVQSAHTLRTPRMNIPFGNTEAKNTQEVQVPQPEAGTGQWPRHFPSGCPPPEARPINGIFFRLTKNVEPTQADFLSHTELGRRKSIEDDPVRAAGLSVFSDLGAALGMKGNVRCFRNFSIVKGRLAPEHGVHLEKVRCRCGYTYWPLRDAIPQLPRIFAGGNGEL